LESGQGVVNAAYLSPLPMPQSAMDDTKWRPDCRHNYQKVTHPVARVRTSNTLQSTSISWVRFLEACFGFFPGVIVACMSDYRHKRHNVSSLLYHIVCPAKYRRVIFDAEVDMVLKEICLDIAKRYELAFLEIGTDNDHVHFLVQSVPSYSPTKIVQIIKSLTAREIFHRVPTVKKRLWGGEFWSKGYFISTVGRHGNEAVIRAYVRQQGSEKAYTQLHRQDVQLGLF